VIALAPDLAILDVLLPSGNGFELARSLTPAA
jgi:DNA-binding response OmpR family regulator